MCNVIMLVSKTHVDLKKNKTHALSKEENDYTFYLDFSGYKSQSERRHKTLTKCDSVKRSRVVEFGVVMRCLCGDYL